MIKKDPNIGNEINDALMERPVRFSIGSRFFNLFPVTLGKLYLTSRTISDLGVNSAAIATNPFLEALRLSKEKQEEVAMLVAYHTFFTKEDCFKVEKVKRRANYLRKNLSHEDMAQLLIHVMSHDKVDIFTKYLGIDREKAEEQRVIKGKDEGSSVSFGGKSVYGTLIDTACERYGWTLDYVVWGISYTNLRLLLLDKVNTIILSKEEMRRLHISADRQVVDADNPDNMEMIMKMFKD